MMHKAPFVAQKTLEQWVADGRAVLDDNRITIKSTGVTFQLEPAVRVDRAVSGPDVLRLAGKARSVKAWEESKAEICGTSLIISDIAYDCTEGFLGILLKKTADQASLKTPAQVSRAVPNKQTATQPVRAQPAATPQRTQTAQTGDEAALLEAFFLESLR